jgi:hypothetical protein
MTDDAHVRTVHANAWNILWSATEIVILFGIERERNAATREVFVELSDRIILSPRTAKRLAAALRKALDAHEAECGPTGSPPVPRRVGPPLHAAELLPESPRDESVAQVRDLLAVLRGLQVDMAVERSVKLSRAALHPNRFLLTLAKGALGTGAERRILDASRALAMPEALAGAFAARLPEANYVHAGFEEGGRGSLYKLYLEFWTDWEHEITSQPTRSAPFVVHLGFKWDPRDGARQAVSTYTCYPRLPFEQLRDRVIHLFDPAPRQTLDIALECLERAAARIGRDRMLYLEVSEEGNPRRSFDVNVYKAGLRLRDVEDLVRQACREFAISAERWQALSARVQGERLGHLSGGIDRGGGGFLTFYYGARDCARPIPNEAVNRPPSGPFGGPPIPSASRDVGSGLTGPCSGCPAG